MTLRVRRARGVDEFAAVAALSDEHAASARRYLTRSIETGSCRLDWCFVLEDDGLPVGRIAYWSMPGHGKPIDIVLLNLPWTRDPDFALGIELLQRSSECMRAEGLGSIGYCLDEPAQPLQWQAHLEDRVRFLQATRFLPLRRTRRFEFTDQAFDAGKACPNRFRAIIPDDEEALLTMLARITAESADQYDRDGCLAHGPAAHAQELLDDLRGMRVDPGWWEWLIDEHGGPLGLVLPTAGADFGTIGYIGVDPPHRGLRLVDALLQRGTARLVAEGPSRVVADTDLANHAMAAAFERNGWRRFGTRTEWKQPAP